MYIFESVAHRYGRFRGQFDVGRAEVIGMPDMPAKQFPSLSDSSAWVSPTQWGEALMTNRKPVSKADALNYFTGYVYVAASTIATSTGMIPGTLYVRKKSKSQKFRTVETKAIDRKQMAWLRANKGLRPYLKSAEAVEEVMSHPVLDLLDRVNPFDIPSNLWESTVLFMDLTGEAYWYVPKGTLNRPAQIWVIPSQYITAIPGGTYDDNFIKGWKYRVGKEEKTLALDELICFRYPNPRNQFKGMGCLLGIADAAYNIRQMNIFEQALFENKGRQGGIFVMKEKISPAERERIITQAQEKYAGASKAGKDMVLPVGMDYIRDAMTPEEMSYIKGRQVSMNEIFMGFDVPPGVFDQASNRATAEVAEYRMMKSGVLPRLRKIEETINEKLLPMYGNETGDIFYAFENPVGADARMEAEVNKIYVDMGALAINEVRAERGDEPVEGGDEPLVDNRKVPLTMVGKQPVPGAGPPQAPEKPQGPVDEDDDKAVEVFSAKVLDKVRARLKG